MLCYYKDLTKRLDQKHLPVFCDQGVYQIARHILFCNPDEFGCLVILGNFLLGNFHAIKIGLACIGKYLRDSGVENILIEVNVFGPQVVNQVLEGTNYARSIKGFFYLAEALKRLQLEAFFNESDQKVLDSLDNTINSIITFQGIFTEKSFLDHNSTSKDFEKIEKNT